MSTEKAFPPTRRATCGGLAYGYVPSASMEQWSRAISNLPHPSMQSGREWQEYKDRTVGAANRYLPQDVKDMLWRLAHTLDSEYDGIVLDNLPRTSDEEGRDKYGAAKKSAESEAVLVGLVGVAKCEIFGYNQEKRGALIHRVEPEPDKETTQSNAGRDRFHYHSDNACFCRQLQPQLLALLGAVNESDAATLILTLNDILPNIPAKLLATLREPIFRRRAPESFDFGGYIVASAPSPLIYDDEAGGQHIALPAASFRQETQRAERAMRDFRELLDSLQPRSIIVGPGRLLAFRNTRVVHGRTAFRGRRLLHRVYFTNSLAPHRAATRTSNNTQVFDARLFLGA